MTPSTSVNAFEEFIEGRGGALPDLTVRTGVAEMLAFYETVLPVGCASQNGDMLLFQWGIYDWGDGKHFEINMTRQFIESAAEDDDAISQLQLVFRFAPDKEKTGTHLAPGIVGATRNLTSTHFANSFCRIQYSALRQIQIPRAFPCAMSTYRVGRDARCAAVELDGRYWSRRQSAPG